MCVYNKKYLTNHAEKVKDVECEEQGEDVSHSRFKTDI